MLRLAAPAARRLGVPDGRVRALRRPRGGRAARRATTAEDARRVRVASTLWQRRARRRCRSSTRRIRRPGRRLDARRAGPTRASPATWRTAPAARRAARSSPRARGSSTTPLGARPRGPRAHREASAHLAPVLRRRARGARARRAARPSALHLHMRPARRRLGGRAPRARRAARGAAPPARVMRRTLDAVARARAQRCCPTDAATAVAAARSHAALRTIASTRVSFRAEVLMAQSTMVTTTTTTPRATASRTTTHGARPPGHTHESWAHPGRFRDREPLDGATTRSAPSRSASAGRSGSGKTALVLALCRALRDRVSLGVVTNDIFTREDAEFLLRNEALARRAHPRRRDRRLPARGHPRGHQPQPATRSSSS